MSLPPAERPAREPSVFARIEALRIVLICTLVLLHADPAVELAPAHDWRQFFGNLLQHGPARSAVAVLSAISGYLLFKSQLDLAPRKLLQKKTTTLLLPMVLWNLPLAVLTAVAQARGKLLDQRLQLAGGDPLEWANALLSLIAYPVDYPLHFIRDLFVLSVLAALLGPLLRRAPMATVIGVHIVLGMFDLDGLFLLRDDMPVMFFAGGALACTQANLKALDAQWRPLLVVFAVACLAHVVYGRSEHVTLLRMISVICIWPAFGALAATRFGEWLSGQSRYAFWLFATHAPVLKLLRAVWRPAALGVPDELFWFWAPPVAIAIGIISYRVCARLVPGWLSLMVGGRLTAAKDRQPSKKVEVELTALPK